MSDHVAAVDTDTDTELDHYPLLTRVAGEAAGTFILVFIGLGALLYSGTLREVDPLINALAFGVAFAAAIALFGRVSGGHINPAISLGAAIRGQLRWGDLPAYWLGQLAGGIAAAAVLFLTLPAGFSTQLETTDQALFSQAANSFGDHSYLAQATGGAMSFGIAQVLVLEALAAAILTAVVLARRTRAHLVPVVAGLTLSGLILALEPVTGGSVNPARSSAAAIFAETAALGQLWLFWLAPLIGGAVAGLAYLMFAPSVDSPALAEEDWTTDDWTADDWGADDETADDAEAAAPDHTDADADADADDAEATETTDAAGLPDLDQTEGATLEFDPAEAEPVAQVGEHDEDPDDDQTDGPRGTDPRT